MYFKNSSKQLISHYLDNNSTRLDISSFVENKQHTN